MKSTYPGAGAPSPAPGASHGDPREPQAIRARAEVLEDRLAHIVQSPNRPDNLVEAGLEQEMTLLTEAALALPGDQAHALIPVFERLIARLDELQTRLNGSGSGSGEQDPATTSGNRVSD